MHMCVYGILQLYTGMSIPMEIASDEPVDTLQNMIHTRGGIPYHLQQSTYEDRVLEYGPGYLQKVAENL